MTFEPDEASVVGATLRTLGLLAKEPPALSGAPTIPDTELCVIKDCSHQVMVEAPEVVERHLEAWLDRQAQRAAGASA